MVNFINTILLWIFTCTEHSAEILLRKFWKKKLLYMIHTFCCWKMLRQFMRALSDWFVNNNLISLKKWWLNSETFTLSANRNLKLSSRTRFIPVNVIVNRPSNTKLRQQKGPLQCGCTFTITITGMNPVRELSFNWQE